MPVILPNGQFLPDSTRLAARRGGPSQTFPDHRRLPEDNGPLPRGSVPPQNNQDSFKGFFDQFAGPVEQGFSGQAQFQPAGSGEGFTPSRQSLLDLPIFGGGGDLPRELLPNFAGPIQGQISDALLSQDPFPQELVPPFTVEPGLVQEGFTDESLFGPGSFQQAEAGTAQASGANVDLGQFNATTREVTPDELVSNQLEQLLAGDSAFIENARQRGREAAQDRGALSSSLFAGASERAAIEAGLPIASADAQAFIQAASQNMQAQNNMTLAKLDSKTRQAITNAQLATQASMTNAQLSTQASITNADISGRQNLQRIQIEGQRMMADSRERIAETQLNAQFSMQQGQFAQQQFMETLQQQGRIDLQMLTGRQQAAITQAGFDHNMETAELSHARRIELENLLTDTRVTPQLEFSRANAAANLVTQAMSMRSQTFLGLVGQETDAAGYSRAMQEINDGFETITRLLPLFLDGDTWDFGDFGG